MSDLKNKLNQFDAVDSNLTKLEKMWQRMRAYLARALSKSASDEDRECYEATATMFRHGVRELPKIEGFELTCLLYGYDEVFQDLIEAQEAGYVDAPISPSGNAYAQGDVLREYRVRLGKARRDFVRQHVLDRISEAEAALDAVWERAQGKLGPADADEQNWQAFKSAIEEIDVLLGADGARPPAWGTLRRHMHFEEPVDLADIRERDFPAVKVDLPYLICGEEDMIPLEVDDLAALSSKKSAAGDVSEKLRWESIDFEQFERLVAELVASTPGWQNVKWLQKPTAPDRGRDIEAECIMDDQLTGQVRQRVIFQCKHKPDGSVGKDDISGIAEQIELHGRVDVFVLVTSGAFSEQVIAYAEQRNRGDRLPRWELWNYWDLERRLTSRKGITVKFGLC